MEPAKELWPISDHEAGLSGYRAEAFEMPILQSKCASRHSKGVESILAEKWMSFSEISEI